MPTWTWDTIQTYVHCANYSGEWNDDALRILAQQPFVVFEKYHKAFADPPFDDAEAKIVESCRKVKALNASTQCLMYTESDWARTEYHLGHMLDADPSLELACKDAHTTDTFCNQSAGGFSMVGAGGGCKGTLIKKVYHAYDFNNSRTRELWIERVVNATDTGFVDGAFIDGNRGGWNSNVAGACPKAKKAGWAAGLAQATSELAHRLGPDRTLISNYPTPEALEFCTGGMMERGGDSHAVQQFGKKTCGPWKTPCLLDFHAQYFADPKDGKMASFLLGVQKYGYFGGGSGWGSAGPNACALWLKQFPEFSKPLGGPLGDMKTTTAAWPGALCDSSGSRRANTTGCLFTRAFASGTKVAVGQYLTPDDPSRPHNRGSCIYWSDGSVTSSSNSSHCQPKETIM
jgi:hypothetical protein